LSDVVRLTSTRRVLCNGAEPCLAGVAMGYHPQAIGQARHRSAGRGAHSRVEATGRKSSNRPCLF